jgi:DNA ligase (NAD+)
MLQDASAPPAPAPEYFSAPELCPACAGPLVLRGEFLYCDSRACPEKLSGAVRVWVRNLGLLHIGDSTVDELTDPDSPKIRSVADLYRLSVEDWAECCSGPKMGQKCHTSLHSNKELALELVLASLTIPNFGLSTARDVVQSGFNTVELVLAASYDDLLKVPNVGEKTARFIQEGLLSRRDVILDLATVVQIKPPTAPSEASGPLSGKNVCITGELSRPRKSVQKMILDAGGFPGSSVTKDTHYLVTNDTDTGSKKMQSAKKYGTQVINEQGLYALLGIA